MIVCFDVQMSLLDSKRQLYAVCNYIIETRELLWDWATAIAVAQLTASHIIVKRQTDKIKQKNKENS